MVADVLHFYGWQRSGVYDFVESSALILDDNGNARLGATLPLIVEDRDNDESATGDIAFRIAGPADASGLLPSAITGMMPPPGTTSAQATKYVFVELATPDLPWRYTPRTQPTDRLLQPWIVLVVGTPDEITINQAPSSGTGEDLLPTIEFTSDVARAHPLADAVGNPLPDSARWAHVQERQDGTGRPITRLLSPRPLNSETEYIAAIVPAFKKDGTPRWTIDESPKLPCYHSWNFRSGEAGDFTTLARALSPGEADSNLGQAPLFYPRVDLPDPLWVRGPLAPIASADAPLPLVQGVDVVSEDVQELLESRAAQPLLDEGEPNFWWPIVTVPVYGASWETDPTSLAWGSAINHDPRHRGVAGLGAWAGIELQEQILEAAVTQAGALVNAEQRIRQLVLGLTAAGTLWKHRLPRDPEETPPDQLRAPYQRLLLYGPSLRRIVTTSGSALGAIAGGERALPPRLFSSAARRVLRSGPARTALAAPNAAAPWNVLVQANTCPELVKFPIGLPHADAASDALGLEILESLNCDRVTDDALSVLFDIPEFEGEPDTDAGMDGIRDLCLTGIPEQVDRPCREVDLEDLESSLTEAIDPTVDFPLVAKRVLGGITGLDDQPTAPTEICVGLNLPVWTFLRDNAPDWLLPGVNTLADNSVVALQSNQTFVDAFLVGLSGQTVGELRFRNLPIATGCTPMRMFWGQVNTTVSPAIRRPDIRGIDGWNLICDSLEPNEVPLGHPQHQPCEDEGGEQSSNDEDLVVVFRSDLFRRYPRTTVYSAPAPLSGDKPNWKADPPFDPIGAIDPTFQGSIGEDITFFRFDLNLTDARRSWIVLEEPPPGYSFNNAVPTDATDGAQFARDTFHHPVRVLITGESLIPDL